MIGRSAGCWTFLKESGLEKDTIVLFTSDNGPNPSFAHQRTAGLRGQKWSLYEGGVREPFIIRWPGKVPAGRVNDTAVLSAVDLFPTLCRMAGVPLPPKVAFDGEDLSAAMLGGEAMRSKPLFWEYGRNAGYLRPGVRTPATWWVSGDRNDASPNVAIREGRWKLLLNDDGSQMELYDIAADPNEIHNLAEGERKVAARLSAQALAWRRSLPRLAVSTNVRTQREAGSRP